MSDAEAHIIGWAAAVFLASYFLTGIPAARCEARIRYINGMGIRMDAQEAEQTIARLRKKLNRLLWIGCIGVGQLPFTVMLAAIGHSNGWW